MKDGIILLDKPSGITSFTAVAMMKRRLSVKCGHSGTLDPLATGLLPIMCGKATKLCKYLTEADKSYRAVLRFGQATDTFDITGQVTKECDKEISIEQIKAVIPEFIGKIKQIPPAFSAIKVGGTALYKLAREGKEVTVPEREIEIYSIEIIDYNKNELTIDVECSKGTYIRSLCNDIAIRLGTVGTMSALRRTKTCGWDISEAVSPDCEDIESRIIPMEIALKDFPSFYPDSFFVRLLSNGCAVETKKLRKVPKGMCRVYDGQTLIGLGEAYVKDEAEVFKIITHL